MSDLTFTTTKPIIPAFARLQRALSPLVEPALRIATGLPPGDDALRRAVSAETAAEYDRLTQEAIERDVFGAPTYVLDGEIFWGQDRLDLLERKLAR